MEPTSIYNDPSLAAARTTAQTAAKTATTESTADITLPDMLRSALNKKFSADNPVYAEREGALKNYLNMSTQAPLNVTAKSAGGTSDVVYNPAQQANLIQQYRAPSVARLATLNDLLNLQTGGIENIIGATSRAHQGEVAGLNATAQNASQAYQDLFGEFKARQSEDEFNRSLAAKGLGDGIDSNALLKELLGKQSHNNPDQYFKDVDEYVAKYGIDAAHEKNPKLIGPRGYS